MNVRHVLSAIFLLCGASCAVQFDNDYNGEQNDDSDTEEHPQKIPSVSASSSAGEMYLDPWDCGTELIKIESPTGSIHWVEVPIPCDPTQDEYRGCPIDEPSNVESESITSEL